MPETKIGWTMEIGARKSNDLEAKATEHRAEPDHPDRGRKEVQRQMHDSASVHGRHVFEPVLFEHKTDVVEERRKHTHEDAEPEVGVRHQMVLVRGPGAERAGSWARPLTGSVRMGLQRTATCSGVVGDGLEEAFGLRL